MTSALAPLPNAGVRGRAPSPDPTASPGGARLLITDLRVAYLLANEARYRALERVFGISRDQANFVTFALLLLTAETVSDKVERALHGIGGPTRADAALGTALANEVLGEIAGRPARDTPMFGALVALALVGGLSVPAVRRSMHGVSAASHHTLVAFRHRYGYLVAHGRRIARTRRSQAAPETGGPKPHSTSDGEVASPIRDLAA
jgi:hypothetical protein